MASTKLIIEVSSTLQSALHSLPFHVSITFTVIFLLGFLRPSVWKSGFRARGKGVEGNMVGEGRILGGVFVVGPGEQGILLDHKEKEFGDKVDLQDVRDAVLRMKSSL